MGVYGSYGWGNDNTVTEKVLDVKVQFRSNGSHKIFTSQ